jgi:hypothetical protein
MFENMAKIMSRRRFKKCPGRRKRNTYKEIDKDIQKDPSNGITRFCFSAHFYCRLTSRIMIGIKILGKSKIMLCSDECMSLS